MEASSGGGQRYTDRGVTGRRKRPLQRCAQIVDPWDMVRQPFVGWPRLRLRLGAFKNIQITSGVASCHRVKLTSLDELLEGISPGRFEQPIACHRAADVRGHERFRDQARQAIDDFCRANLVIRRYRARGPECEAAGEDCQAAQPHALVVG